MLHDEHAVARIPQPLQQLEKSVHVARVQTDGRLVQNVERVDELRAQGIREADALRLAARQSARRTIHREIGEPDIAQKSDAVTRLLEDHLRDSALKLGKRQLVEPDRELVDWQVRHLGDVETADPHVERFGLKLRPVAARTFLRCLILTEENADVLLVPLLLEIAQEGKNSLVAACLRMKEQLSLRGGELIPGLVHRNALATCELRQCAPLVVVPRLGPRVYRAVTQRAGGVGNHQRLVVLENRPEPVALRARAARIVEREELRRGRGRKRAVIPALEQLGKPQLAHRQSVEGRHDRIREQDHAVSLALGERGSDSIAQASGAFR